MRDIAASSWPWCWLRGVRFIVDKQAAAAIIISAVVSRDGLVHHCDYNAVPGILGFGEVHDIAGLIAPRALCIVNGAQDDLFALEEVDRAVAGLREIYAAASVPDRFVHRYGPAGHRFYADSMWPFIRTHVRSTH